MILWGLPIGEEYLALFTSEEKMCNVKTSKFRYTSLVNFASAVHTSINRELRGIVINPGDDNYIIPVEVLIENWSLIYRTCNDDRVASANYCVFLSDSNDNH